MHWSRNRMLALGGLAAGVLAALGAVVSGLDAHAPGIAEAKAAQATISSRTVLFGSSRVVAKVRPGGLLCFSVKMGSSTVGRSCLGHLYPDQIGYATSRHAVGGLAGADVHAVIVRLTRKGTVWATLRRGAFYAAVPKGHNVRAVVKVLANGTRTSFTVTGPR